MQESGGFPVEVLVMDESEPKFSPIGARSLTGPKFTTFETQL